MDLDKIADAVFEGVKGMLARRLEPLLDRLKALEEHRPANGADGRDGRDGRDGAHGRDAADLVIYDGLDADKSYPAGTFVAAEGGLLRSIRPTDPLRDSKGLRESGWVVIVAGLKSVSTALDDGGRSLTVTLETTTGPVVNTVKTAIPVERGVHRDGRDYDHGDVVEWAGEAWIATKDAPEGKPDASEDWRRLVRRGRTGKSGENIVLPARVQA